MKKQIKFSNGEVKEMSYEEILEQFKQMINGFAYTAVEKIVYNKPEMEEVLQELRIQTWIAFEKYNGKYAFSTYLHYRLQLGVAKATTKLYAKKRTNKNGSISINEIIGSEGEAEKEFQELLGEDDLGISSFVFRDFLNSLEKTLKPCEKKILKVLIDKSDYSVQDLAIELGISRQGANKKVNKFREKMADILINSGYVEAAII